MKKLILLAVLLFTGCPIAAPAQDATFLTAQLARLQDARQQVNLAENDAGRALTRLDKEIAAVKAEIARLKTPAPAPTPTPAPDPNAIPASIPSNFDINSELLCDTPSATPVKAGVACKGSIPAREVADGSEGAFRFICNASHESYDDPILYPGQPGKSHLHQWFGNTKADANSSYESLRKTGGSTCMTPLNRSAYWMPAMLNGKGQVVRPDYVGIYYKRMSIGNPRCHLGNPQAQGDCVSLPRGLRFVFGYNMIDPWKAPTGNIWFSCEGPTAIRDNYRNIVQAAKNCPIGNQLGLTIQAPDCWDGKNLDSADHRSHVAYANYDNGQGFRECPKTHPKVIPQFQLSAWYTVDADLDRSGKWTPETKTWSLSSDNMPGMAAMLPGTTFHSDWFGAWDDSTMQTWMDHCIDKGLNCSGGQLGDGTTLKQFAGFKWVADPHVVDVPGR